MKSAILILTIILNCFSFNCFSQNLKVSYGTETNVTVNTIETYERIAEKGYRSAPIFQKIGNAYYFKNDFEKAARWYCELFYMDTDLEPEYYDRYVRCLKSIGKNDEANEILEKFNQKSKNDK